MVEPRVILGVDVGSVSVSVAAVSSAGEVLHGGYTCHQGEIATALERAMEGLDPASVAAVVATTSTPQAVKAEQRYDSKVAIIRAAQQLHCSKERIGFGSILVIGGEKFGVLLFDEQGRYLSYRTNTSCAAGTGSFLDQHQGGPGRPAPAGAGRPLHPHLGQAGAGCASGARNHRPPGPKLVDRPAGARRLHHRLGPQAERCEDGLTALAMVDEARVDPRDVAWAAGLLSYSISAVEADRSLVMGNATALATPPIAEILEEVSDDLSNWGYAEIRTERGVGLIQSGGARYEPTLEIGQLSLRLAEMLRGRYVADAKIATKLPLVWFAQDRRDDVEEVLKHALAAVSIHGSLHEEHRERADRQRLLLWVVELPDENQAAALVEDLPAPTADDERFSAGVAVGRLFSFLVAGSWAVGVEPYETPESLAVFAGQTREELAKTAASEQR